MRATRRNIVLCLSLAWLAAPAAAHPIVIHAGALEWTDRSLRLTLSLDWNGLEHELLALGRVIPTEKLTRTLAESVQVFSPNGERIDAACITTDQDGKRVVREFAIPADMPAVALQQRDSEHLAQLTRQLQFAWTPPGEQQSRVIRLTSGGNHAVLRRETALDIDDLTIDPFTEPVLVVAADEQGRPARVRIDFPCTLLATWPELLDLPGDVITSEQFRQSKASINQWAHERLSIAADDEEPPTLTVESVDLIGPSDETLTDSPDAAHSVFTTRARIQFKLDGADEHAALTWQGFNGFVLRTPVVFQSPDGARLVGAQGWNGRPARLVGYLTPTQPTTLKLAF